MVVKVSIRLFTIPIDVHIEHSYLVGSALSGLSDTLTVVPVREASTECGAFTFEHLRWKLETQQDGIMTKRTLAYREILSACSSVRNYHKWNERVRQFSYRFGYYPKSSAMEGFPKLVDLEMESSLDVLSFLREQEAEMCVVAVPLAHVGPVCEQVCKGCGTCTQRENKSGSTKDELMTSYYFEGSVYKVQVSDIERAYPVEAVVHEEKIDYQPVNENFI